MVIVIHEGLECENLSLHFLSFDFFVKENENPKNIDGYEIDCKIAKKFLEQHNNYKYVASQDLTHNSSLNAAIISDLISRTDIDEIYFYDEYYKEFKLLVWR